MPKLFVVFSVLLIYISSYSQTQDYYKYYEYDHDPLPLRGAAGIGHISITGLDTIPNRVAVGIYGLTEVRLLSDLTDNKKKGFTVYDAFYLDLFLGTMLSAQLTYFTPERKHALSSHFGYLILTGYRNNKIGIMCGVNFQTVVFNVGTTNTKHMITAIPPPVVAKIEFRPAFGYESRIITTIWNNFTKERKSKGIRFDIPLAKAKRYFLTFEASTIINATVHPDNFEIDKFTKGNLNQLMIGFRYGSIY